MFLSEASISSVVPLMNNILHSFIEPTSFIANRLFIEKFKFEKLVVFSDVIEIYVNLNVLMKLFRLIRDLPLKLLKIQGIISKITSTELFKKPAHKDIQISTL